MERKNRKTRRKAENVPPIEVNTDTVYIRSGIKRVEEEDFTGWEYDEIQYSLREYVEGLLQTETGQIIIAENTAETLSLMLSLNAQQQIEQAEANAELINLIIEMGGI